MSLGLWTGTQLSSTQHRNIVRLLKLMKWLVQRLHMQQDGGGERGVALINCPCLWLAPKKKSEQSIFHRSQIWSTFVIKQPPLPLLLPPPSNRITKTSATTQLEAAEGERGRHGCLLVAYVTRRDADKYAKRALGQHRNFRQRGERERDTEQGGGGQRKQGNSQLTLSWAFASLINSN